MRLASPRTDKQALFGRAMLVALEQGDSERAALFARAFLLMGPAVNGALA